VGHGVKLEVTNLEGKNGVGGGAAGDGAETGEELLEGERFGEVVVDAAIQTADDVGLVVAGGEHEYGSNDFSLAQTAGYVEAIHAGEHGVEDNGLEGLGAGESEALWTGGCGDDTVHLALKGFGQDDGHFAIIFDEEDSHVLVPQGWDGVESF